MGASQQCGLRQEVWGHLPCIGIMIISFCTGHGPVCRGSVARVSRQCRGTGLPLILLLLLLIGSLACMFFFCFWWFRECLGFSASIRWSWGVQGTRQARGPCTAPLTPLGLVRCGAGSEVARRFSSRLHLALVLIPGGIWLHPAADLYLLFLFQHRYVYFQSLPGRGVGAFTSCG